MWKVNALMALDLARERSREAEAAARWRGIAELAAEERRAHPELYPARGRALLAAILRRLSAGADAIATAACRAAVRVEGRTAWPAPDRARDGA